MRFGPGIKIGPGVRAGFEPRPVLGEGAVLWLDPTQGLIQSGGYVDQITDRSASSNHATAAGGARPAVDSINGVAAYLIDGGTHAVPTLGSEVATARTLFLVYDRTGLAMPPTLSTILGSNATYYDFAGGTTQPHLLDGASVAAGLCGVRGGGTAEIRINGDWAEIVREADGSPETEKPGTPSVITLMTGANVRFNNLGMDRVTSRVDHSRRGDLMVFDSALDARRIVETENALMAKYGIAPTLAERVIVFSGNSIVAGQGVSQGTEDFPSLALTLVNTPAAWKKPHFRAYNVGIGGQSTTQMLIGDPVSVDRKLSEYHSANVVVLCEGGNDLHYGASAATALANLIAAYTARRAACPGAIVGVTTILPRSSPATPPTFNADRATVNAGLVAALGSNVIDFAGNATMGPDAASENPTYYPDKVHPSAAGHAILAQIAADWIDAKAP